MKTCLAAISITLIIAACGANQSKNETKPVTGRDTVVAVVPDSVNHPAEKNDPGTKEPDPGGVGGLNLGLSQAKTTGLLGEPDSRSKAEEWGADGLMHQDWFYKTRGITLNMSSDKNLADQEISSITITAPCALKTNKNIGIGSSYKEVMAAYEKDVDPSASDKTSITIGSVYGGIICSLKNDKVAKIFIGAAAE